MVRPLIFHDTTAAILFFASLAAINLAIFVLLPRSQAQTLRDWPMHATGGLLLAGLAGASVTAWLRLAPLPGNPWWPVIVGLAMMWVASALRAWSILTLGRFFQFTVVLQDDHRLIDSGPYRWLRHPAYLGAIVNLVGIGVAEGDWTSTGTMLVCTLVASVVLIRIEERVLLAELGDEYAQFTRGKARLIPSLF